jgi:N6-L-threonylcarbamoyladenine synthase
MIILGIESSCDETAVAIVKDGNQVLSNTIASQILIHRKTSGVVPEVAARAHLDKFDNLLELAFKESGSSWDQIDAIAVTAGPGLVGCLLNGITYASTLAALHNKPLISVNHIHGHILSATIGCRDEVKFPIAVLSVSGGHNDLYIVRSFTEFEKIGQTLDDAAGEAYDKAAKMLGLDYPGGPSISKEAINGDSLKYDLPRPMLNKGYDFSFSGLKTALSLVIEKCQNLEAEKSHIAASFQAAANDVLSQKLMRAAAEFKVKEVHLVGGVSANLDLRERILKMAQEVGVTFRHPADFKLCTDNAGMIAAAAFYADKSSWLKSGEVPKLIMWSD